MQKCLKFFLHSKKLCKATSFLKHTNRPLFYKPNLKLFSLKNDGTLQLDQKTQNDDTKNVCSEVQERITINLNNIQGTRSSDSGYLVASFVCKKCETRNTKKFSKRSYTEGIVIIRCDGCKNLHLIADNLGWFEDSNVNIEDLMKRKGEEVKKISCDGLLNLVSDENVKI